MAQRLVRAKQKIAHAGIPFRVPPAHLLPERTAGRTRRAVPAVQRGVRATPARPDRRAGRGGDPAGPGAGRADARRARGAGPAGADAAAATPAAGPRRRRRRPGHPGGAGPHPVGPGRRSTRARRSSTARCAAAGPGRTSCRPRSRPATRPRRRAADTDWPQIVGLYDGSSPLAPSPGGGAEPRGRDRHGRRPGGGAGAGRGAGEPLNGYYLWHATRADLLRRAGRAAEARESYRAALDLAPSESERRFLSDRLRLL